MFAVCIMISTWLQVGHAQETIQLFQPERMFPNKAQRDTMSAEEMKKLLSLNLYTANAREDLDTIGAALVDVPYVIIKRVSFLEGVKAVNGLQSKIAEYGKLDTAYQDLQRIDSQRTAVFQTILEEERNRTQLFMSTNDTLRMQIDELNTQFKEASRVSKKAIKGRNFKTWRMGIVGGIIGLAAGMLFGAI